jgi:hypothetical protein
MWRLLWGAKSDTFGWIIFESALLVAVPDAIASLVPMLHHLVPYGRSSVETRPETRF